MSKVSQTFEFNFKFNDNNASKQLKAISNDVKQMIAEMGDASDKMQIFKKMVSYLNQVDSALGSFKAKNKDLFDQLFGGLDESLTKELSKLFGIMDSEMANFGGLKQRIQDASNSKARLETLRNIAEDINGLYTSIGAKEPINIDELFTGKGSKKTGTDFENRIKILTDAIDSFAIHFQDINNKLKDGFQLGGSSVDGGALGISTTVKNGADELQAEIDNLEEQLDRLDKVNNDSYAILKKVKAAKEGNNVFDLGEQFSVDQIEQIIDEFNELKETLNDFGDDRTSIEYFETLSKYMLKAAELSDIGNKLIGAHPGSSYQKMFQTLEQQKNANNKSYAGLLTNAYDNALQVIEDDSLVDDLYAIDDVVDATNDKLEELRAKLGQVNTASTTDGIASSIDKVGKHAVDTAEYVQNLAIQVEKLFQNINSMSGTLEYKILINGQDIDIKQGDKKGVSMQTTAETYLGALNKNSIVSAHNHPGGASSRFNAYDFRSTIADVYGGIAQMGAIISEQDITTLNLAGVKLEDALSVLKEIEKMNVQSISADKINELFTALNTDYKNIATVWDSSQFSQLAQYIYNVGESANKAIDPLTKFKNILQIATDGKIDLSKYEDLFSNFSVNHATSMFNDIMSQEGKQLRVDDISTMSLNDLLNTVSQYRESFAQLRNEAKITYSEIHNYVKAYLDEFKQTGTSSNMDGFLKQYFDRDDVVKISDWLIELENGEASIEQITNKIASHFQQIDPSEFIKETSKVVPNVSSKLKAFNDILEEAKSKWMQDVFSDVELVTYAEKLSTARQELQAFADQGAITADEMKRVNEEFDNINSKLKQTAQYNEEDRRSHSGYYMYSYESEYERVENENQDLRNENDELKAENEDLKNKLQDQVQKLDVSSQQAEVKVADHATNELNVQEQTKVEDSSKEISQHQDLLAIIEKVKQAVNEKTEAFRTEATTVDSVVNEEVTSFQRLQTYLEELRTIIQNVFSGNAAEQGVANQELTDLNRLKEAIFDIEAAVNNKNDAFQNEAIVVNQSVQQEIESLNRLKTLLDEIQNTLQIVFATNGQSFGNINFGQDKTNSESPSSILQEISSTLSSIYGVLQGFTGIKADNENSAQYKGTSLDRQIDMRSSDYFETDQIKDTRSKDDDWFDNEVAKITQIKDTVDEQDKINVNELSVGLKDIESILEQIYGVLHGFTGIESENKNSVKYTEPVVETTISKPEISEQDFSVLNSILQAVQEINNYLHTTKSDNISEFENKDIDQSKLESDVYQLLTSKLPQNIATEDTLVAIKSIIEQLAQLSKAKDDGQDFNIKDTVAPLIESLSSIVNVLQNVADNLHEATVNVSPSDDSQKSNIAATAVNTTLSEPIKIDIGGANSLDGAEETASLQRLLECVEKVRKAVNAKTKAFKDEGKTVENVVAQEIVSLQKLVEKLNDVKTAVGEKTQAFKDEAGVVADTTKEVLEKKEKEKTNNKKSASKMSEENNLKLSAMSNSAKSNFNKTGIDVLHPDNIIGEQKNIYDQYVKLLDIISELKKNSANATDAQVKEALELYDALMKNVEAYNKQKEAVAEAKKVVSKAANDANKQTNKNKTYAKNKVESVQRKYDSVESIALPYVNEGSTIVTGKLSEYQDALQKLVTLKNKLDTKGSLTKEEFVDFDLLANKCNKYARELETVIKKTEELRDGEEVDKSGRVDGGIDLSDITARESALKQFVEVNYKAIASIGDFDKKSNTLNFTLKNGDGTIRQMKASFDAVRTSIVATAGGAKQATSGFGAFFDSIASKSKELWVYAASRFGVDEVIQVVRQGVEYVREIDTALTELKKVTNETDATYDAFLQTMSKTAGAVGGTVSDLTTMAADWSKLGYSIEEAGKLAESTAILLNVSEFSDANAASEALISTMQAFQYTAEDSQHVVDILNEVKLLASLYSNVYEKDGYIGKTLDTDDSEERF